jgi:hypothetical protein
MGKPMEPPPTSYTGTAIEWRGLSMRQRQDIRGVARRKCDPPPDSFEGSDMDWAALTSKQRYALRWPGRKAELHRKLREKSPERFKAVAAKHYVENRDAINARNKEWIANHKEQHKASVVQWNLKHKEQVRIWVKAYRKRPEVWARTLLRNQLPAKKSYGKTYYQNNKVGHNDFNKMRYRTDSTYRALQSTNCKTYYKNHRIEISAKGKARRCRQANEWWEKWGSAEALAASRKALKLENNRGKPWASTYARDRAMEASFEAVDNV